MIVVVVVFVFVCYKSMAKTVGLLMSYF